MKRTFAIVACAAVFAFTGCDKGTPGGVGATNSNKTVGQEDKSFSLSPPMLSTSLKQGEAKSIDISIKRGKNFDEDVSLKFEELPKGLTIDPASPTIKHSDKETKITLKAADDAAVGDFTIMMKGHPEKGQDAENKLKVTVKKK